MHHRPPRRPCPVCGWNIAVTRATERLRTHGPTDNPCPGSGTPVDLYGGGR